MTWRITGADANSGDAVSVEVQCDTEVAARLEAKKRRILVEDVVRVEPLASLPLRDPVQATDASVIIMSVLGAVVIIGGIGASVSGREIVGAISGIGGLILIGIACILNSLSKLRK
jgi:hypothetical protein